jgi:hypothetical protein
MMVRNLCVSGFVTACALALPVVADGQGDFTLDAKNALAARLRDLVCAGRFR